MKKIVSFIVAVSLGLNLSASAAIVSEKLPLLVEHNIPGAPQLLGIPFAKGKLLPSDHIRVLNATGVEIPSQITIVSTWSPTSESIKWIWVFFFSETSKNYSLEFGKDVVRKEFAGDRVVVENNQRPYGRVKVSTGPLQFIINRLGGGFLDKVSLDTDKNGFDKQDLIGESSKTRGSFLDILDKAGIDSSRVKITNTVLEKGSGPLHAIIRIDGDYLYRRKDNNTSPFVMRIHAYAGKSYIRVLHTIIYTGDPDMHQKREGEYSSIATQNKNIVDEKAMLNDKGWMIPNDQVAGAGFDLKYNLNGEKKLKTGYFDGSWTNPGEEKIIETDFPVNQNASLLQTGPNVNRIPPLNNSSPTQQIKGFKSTLNIGQKELLNKERMAGWITLTDKKWGIGVGIRNFFEEYPKEIAIQGDSSKMYSYIWSPKVAPMSFARASMEFDSEMLGNFAQGLAKTTEIVYQFFPQSDSESSLVNNFKYFLDPPVTHANPEWYANSKVYGSFAVKSDKHPELERSLDYKLDWMRFNQKWEPWYGMIDYGDFMTYFPKNKWDTWNSGEPAIDFMWWMQFMRTGNRDYYLTANACSQHTMDIDNIHWPNFPKFLGDTNNSIDFFNLNDSARYQGSPYIGMGRRHAAQHFTSLLSAHVWVAGWIASYYLSGDHRALDVAEEAGDLYLRRIFGGHDLQGRRLYLSIWNLTELFDADKKEKYFTELKDRVRILLELQKSSEQGGSLIIERYGYSQVYISQGLYKYYQITGDQKVKQALITHAMWQRDNPSINHAMESFLASVPSILLGYELTGDRSFLDEAVKRAAILKTDKLPMELMDYPNQKELVTALEKVSHLPDDKESFRGEAIWKITNGLRIFGWTHIYSVPYLLNWMDQKPVVEK
ncbi:MAG: hypothetical protein WCP08_10815 [Prolixibacteraceae bacterium]